MELKNKVQDLENQLRITQVSTSAVSILIRCVVSLDTIFSNDKPFLDYYFYNISNTAL